MEFLRKVRETGMRMDNRSHPRARPVRTAERIAAVAQVCVKTQEPQLVTEHNNLMSPVTAEAVVQPPLYAIR
ncbi:hypothetical protein NQ318_004658 [Aromia moschata]|uniref:Uncharacterized protein n=1 Tax=Aromia moschata TaxID=1265417 RepID=A0AAV8Y6I0_9CUCU|nr:hypothetical protein NQ318_004658 [Aromia moschata]